MTVGIDVFPFLRLNTIRMRLLFWFPVIGCKICIKRISEGSRLWRKTLDIFDKFCPICKNLNERDAVRCKYCGASLEYSPGDADGKTRTTEMPTNGKEGISALHLDEAMIPAGGIAIYIESLPNPVFLSFDDEFVIGRKVGEVPKAFLDLSPFGGYHLGLSRRHAMIRREQQGYEVIDLSSSNGTWLNNERLVPHQPYPLASGSQLRLSRMRFFVLYRCVAETKEKI